MRMTTESIAGDTDSGEAPGFGYEGSASERNGISAIKGLTSSN